MLEPNAIMSYNAGCNACGTGEQWQRAATLLGGAGVISYSTGSSACEPGEQGQLRRGPTGPGPAPARGASSGSGLRRCSASCGGEKLEPSVISRSAGHSRACETGEQGQPAPALLSEVRGAMLEPSVMNCSACISSCENSGQ